MTRLEGLGTLCKYCGPHNLLRLNCRPIQFEHADTHTVLRCLITEKGERESAPHLPTPRLHSHHLPLCPALSPALLHLRYPHRRLFPLSFILSSPSPFSIPTQIRPLVCVSRPASRPLSWTGSHSSVDVRSREPAQT